MRSRPLVAVAVVLVSSGALAAPPTPNTTAPTARVAKARLTLVKPSDAEVARAKVHAFRPANVAMAIPEDQSDGPALVPARRIPLKIGPTTPKLNVGKFGEAVHAAFKDNVRGYALGLRKNGQPVLTLIWDSARTGLDGSKAWSLDTRMHVASVSKLMTGIIATKMLDERNLPIDTKIANYIPTYWNEANSSDDLTFRQLLTHAAGFTIYDGDYASFKKQIEQGVSPGSSSALGYTNGSFSLVRVLAATMTGGVDKNAKFEMAGLSPDINAKINDAIWDVKASEAFLSYAQAKVFTPSGVSSVSGTPNANQAVAYSGKVDIKGWDSGELRGELGGAGFRLSVNEVLNVMGTFRRKGTIVSPEKAKAAIEAKLGIDQIIDTPAGKIYNKNGAWRTGKDPSSDIEQSVAYYLQEDMECVVLVNSWLGAQQASLRGAVKDAYIANLE